MGEISVWILQLSDRSLYESVGKISGTRFRPPCEGGIQTKELVCRPFQDPFSLALPGFSTNLRPIYG
jgi:hypothetical protein